MQLRLWVCALMIAALSACSSDYKALSKEAPEPHDYNSALASEYLSYADSEAELKYWRNAEKFSHKGREALTAKEIELEDPAQWGIKGTELDALQVTRTHLQELLTDDIKHIIPQKAAHAQLLYDCWVVQAARHEQSDGVYPCALELAAVMDDLRETNGRLPAEEEVQ